MREACEGMEFNPFRVPDGQYMFTFYAKIARRKRLHSIPEETFEALKETAPGPKELDLMLRFVSLFCSTESPYFREENYEERIIACWAALDIGEKHPLVLMVKSNHWWYSDILCAFMEMINNDLFSNWLAFKMSAREMRNALMMRLSDAEEADKFMNMQTKVSASIDKTQAAALALELKLFPHSKMAQAAFEAATADETVGGFAEEFALDFSYINKKK